MELKVIFKFDAAHQLTNYTGDCSNLHGHTWKVVVILKGRMKNARNGILVDFKVLKEAIRDILPDHKFLNLFYGIEDPTAEFIACQLYNQINHIVAEEYHWPVDLKSVEVWESDTASAKVENEDL